jgi:hypothetical protein
MAFELSDTGHGSFERCFYVLLACDGDVKDAEKLLSRIMMKESGVK